MREPNCTTTQISPHLMEPASPIPRNLVHRRQDSRKRSARQIEWRREPAADSHRRRIDPAKEELEAPGGAGRGPHFSFFARSGDFRSLRERLQIQVKVAPLLTDLSRLAAPSLYQLEQTQAFLSQAALPATLPLQPTQQWKLSNLLVDRRILRQRDLLTIHCSD